MTVEEISDKLISIYENPENGEKERMEAYSLVYKIREKLHNDGVSLDDLKHTLNAAKRIASTKRKYKQILEKELLSYIRYLPIKLWDEEEKPSRYKRNDGSENAKLADLLVSFALEIYEIKLDRDAFSGKRRGYAVEILQSVSSYFDVPEFMELCLRSLKNKGKAEFISCVESLKEYCIENKIIPSEEALEILEERIEKTKDRSELVSCLNFQVETGKISEFGAMSELDLWKEKNYDY